LKKKFISIVILFLILGTTFMLFNLSTTDISATTQSTTFETYHEGFETPVPQDGWTFAHQTYFSRSTAKVKEGSYSLKVSPNSDGQTYDGVQYHKMFIDGSIEVWAYCTGSNYLIPALWLRTSGIKSSTNPSFKDGYMLRLYVDKASLYKYDSGVSTNLGTFSTGYIASTWWHLKLEAIGNEIKAWITTGETFSETPQITYTDSKPLTIGKAAFSARTKMSSSTFTTFFDSLTITYSTEKIIEESFETAVPQEGWTYAHQSYYSQSTEKVKDGSYSLKVTPNSEGQTYDGVEYDLEVKDGSIEGWFYCKDSNYLIPALWIRTSGFNETTNPTFANGYWLRLYVDKATLYKRENGVNTALGSYTTGYYLNTWYHLKLEVVGNSIKAWISTTTAFDIDPQISYQDSNPIQGGKVGFSTRTKMSLSIYNTYVDDLKIVLISGFEIPPNDNLWAIIIAAMDEERFTRDALGMYTTLTSYYGITAEHAYLITPWTEIDGKTVPRDYETSKKSIESAFGRLALELDETDDLIVWWTGHGDPDVFPVWERIDDGFPNEMTADELDALLDDITCHEMYIYLGPCQSGSFIDNLNDNQNRAIYTSCEATGVGYVMDGHSLFPWATYRGLDPTIDAFVADEDQNSKVSLYELFSYCKDFINDMLPEGTTQNPQSWVGSLIDSMTTYLREEPF